MRDPGYWQILAAERAWGRVVIGGALIIAHAWLLQALYVVFEGLVGEGWNYGALLAGLLWHWAITETVQRRYWRRQALAAEKPRQVDVTKTITIPDGTPSPEFLAAMDREFAARRAATNSFRR